MTEGLLEAKGCRHSSRAVAARTPEASPRLLAKAEAPAEAAYQEEIRGTWRGTRGRKKSRLLPVIAKVSAV